MSNNREPVESVMMREFFPTTREEWRRHYSPPLTGKKMTREEHIAHTAIMIHGIILHRTMYEAYRKLSWQGSERMLPFEEAVIKLKPWLASDEEFAKWQELEPFDRFVLMSCGLPWNDETIALVKQNDGVRRTEPGTIYSDKGTPCSRAACRCICAHKHIGNDINTNPHATDDRLVLDPHTECPEHDQ